MNGFNPSKGRQVSVSMRPAWSPETVPRWLGLRETNKKEKKGRKEEKKRKKKKEKERKEKKGKHLTGGLFTVSEDESMVIMVGSKVVHRHATWCKGSDRAISDLQVGVRD